MGYLSPCKTNVQTLEHIFILSKKITMFVKITVHLKALVALRVFYSFKHFGCIESFLVEYGMLTSDLGPFYICQTMHSVLSLSNILTRMHSVISSMTVATILHQPSHLLTHSWYTHHPPVPMELTFVPSSDLLTFQDRMSLACFLRASGFICYHRSYPVLCSTCQAVTLKLLMLWIQR